jgi:hypothetical protein
MRRNSSLLTRAAGLLSIDIVGMTTATSDRVAWVKTAPILLKIPSVDKDLALLERRAKTEGFQV